MMDAGTKLADAMPVETYQAARKIYNIQNVYLTIGDNLPEILCDLNLSLLDPMMSLNTDRVCRLALITAFQYAESLADAEAAQATLKRMDWKYALYLPIKYSGIPAQALCDFRHNLYTLPSGLAEFRRLVSKLSRFGLFAQAATRPLDAEEMILAVCTINRIYRLHQAMTAALSALGSAEPEWLLAHRLPHWVERYGNQSNGLRARLAQGKMEVLAIALGVDGFHLLDSISSSGVAGLQAMPEVRVMQRLWGEQYRREGGNIVWRKDACRGCA